jgi:hypothetical protein
MTGIRYGDHWRMRLLTELDEMAGELNISRQAVIKSFLRQALDQHRLDRS